MYDMHISRPRLIARSCPARQPGRPSEPSAASAGQCAILVDSREPVRPAPSPARSARLGAAAESKERREECTLSLLAPGLESNPRPAD